MPVLTPAYGGLATISFNEAKHYYTVSVPCRSIRNLYQPSVTTVLGMKDKSKVLLPWAVDKMAERTLKLVGDAQIDKNMLTSILDVAKDSYNSHKQNAAEIGSLVHRTLEKILLHRVGMSEAPTLPLQPDTLLAPNLTADMVEAANRSIDAGVGFFDEHQIEVLQAEAPRWSPTYGYIGTGDLIARVDGELSILDYKSGKHIYPEYFLQTAAYQAAYEEEHEEKIQRRWIVNVSRDTGKLQVETRDNSTFDEDFGTFLALLRVFRWHCENQGPWSKPAPTIVGPLKGETVCHS